MAPFKVNEFTLHPSEALLKQRVLGFEGLDLPLQGPHRSGNGLALLGRSRTRPRAGNLKDSLDALGLEGLVHIGVAVGVI